MIYWRLQIIFKHDQAINLKELDSYMAQGRKTE